MPATTDQKKGAGVLNGGMPVASARTAATATANTAPIPTAAMIVRSLSASRLRSAFHAACRKAERTTRATITGGLVPERVGEGKVGRPAAGSQQMTERARSTSFPPGRLAGKIPQTYED